MTKTIIFDFDGTLADTFHIAIECLNELCEKHGREKFKEPNKLRDKTLRNAIREDFKISIFQIPFYLKQGKELTKSKIKEIKIFKEIKEVLTELSEKYDYNMGILTSCSREIVQGVLDREKIDTIKFIFSNSSVFGKHRSIKKLLNERNLKKEDIVYIGDEARDIEACKKLKTKMIAVSWGWNSKKLLRGLNPEYLINNPRELITLLNPRSRIWVSQSV